MRLIVCDTGPILHLTEARLLELLQKSGKVYIPLSKTSLWLSKDILSKAQEALKTMYEES